MKIFEAMKDKAEKAHVQLKKAALVGSTSAMVVVPTMFAYAEEGGGTVTGKNLLSGTLMTSIQQAFADLQATAVGVIGVAVVSATAVIGISAGTRFAIKQVKGVLSKAG